MFAKIISKLRKRGYEVAMIFIILGTFCFLRCTEKDWKSLVKEENAFIHDTFVETCKGNGFSSLDEWQSVCREKFHLDYIGWCAAADFIVIEPDEEGVLYYGKWHGKNGYGEVYARMAK